MMEESGVLGTAIIPKPECQLITDDRDAGFSAQTTEGGGSDLSLSMPLDRLIRSAVSWIIIFPGKRQDRF